MITKTADKVEDYSEQIGFHNKFFTCHPLCLRLAPEVKTLGICTVIATEDKCPDKKPLLRGLCKVKYIDDIYWYGFYYIKK